MSLERPDWPTSFDAMLERMQRKTASDRVADQRAREAEDFARYRESVRCRAVELCRSLSEIGARFEQRTFANFDSIGNETALAAAHEIVDDAASSGSVERLGGYFWSPECGNGKSHLGGAIVNACVERGIAAVFITADGLMRRIRDTYNRRGDPKEGELDIIRRLSEVRVLVLDDVGTERFTPDSSRLLYALVNGRYEANLGIVATSNLCLADLGRLWARSGVEEHLAHKIVDRLVGMCSFKVRVHGQSRRGAA